jgi:carbamoyltransferase
VEIQDFLNKNDFIYTKLNGDYSPVVEKLTERNIVGWMQGRAEFGPRALGNRSILTAPFPADIKDHINARVKFREPFRPFAPAVLNSHASEYFHIQQESPHMLMAVQVRQDKKEAIPAVIHVDDSARVQTVKRENNEAFYNLLSLFENKTGCPVLLNTSFNVKGQPIVNDISDAVKCFMDTNIDVLVAGDYMVVKEEQR